MRQSDSALPFILAGLLLAVLFIGSSFFASPPNLRVLQPRFLPQTPDPSGPTDVPFELPQIPQPSLPPDVQSKLKGLQDRLSGGQAIPALTPIVQEQGIQIEVRELRREGEAIQVRGSIKNTGTSKLTIPPDAFVFRDSAGVRYGTQGANGATLNPGEHVEFDLGVPLPEGRGLSLILSVPPAPPIQQILFVEVKS